MKKIAVPLDTWHRFTEESIKEFVGKDILVLHQNKVFIFIKNATLEGIYDWFDEDSMIVDLSSSKYVKVDYISKSEQNRNTGQNS